MLTKRLTRAVCALFMLGALVAFTGCGGSDKSSSSSASTSSDTATTPAPATDTTATGGSSGGGSLAEYKAGAEKAAQDFKNSAQAASQKVQSASGTQGKIAGLEALKKSVTDAADAFEALNPPSNLKADNDELVSEFRSLASTVDDVETALKTNDQAKATAALPKLTELQGKIGQTIARIQTKLGP
jgi:ABC-type phosphate transport system substrate-binding protein